MSLDRIIDVRQVQIPGAVGYYAGDDGDIYRMKIRKIGTEDKYILDKIASFLPSEKHRLLHVNVKIFGLNKVLPVHYMVALAWHGHYKYGMVVKFKDNNMTNTRPQNLTWKFERQSFEKEIETLENITA